MIAKTPGIPRLDKLRVIHIIESDFNLWMGIVCGRSMIYQAESMDLLGDEQSGSRPGEKCQDVVIFKHMIYSVLRMTRFDGITFDNDAKSCFDRIVLAAASLIVQRLGLSKDVMELFIDTLSEVEYFAKTYYGLSTMPYKDSNAHGIHGPGQGGRASPAIWTAISCFLLQCMRENSVGANILSPLGRHIRQVSSGFVDDITHWCITMEPDNSIGQATEQILSQQMQHMAQLWEQLLHLTGGKLELSKCFYYPIMWSFNLEGAATLLPPNQLSSKITLTDSETDKSFDIPSKPCDEAHKTLGVLEQPDGKNSAEVQRLTTKALQHAQVLAGNLLKYDETETYYFAVYVPSMAYSLVVGTFSERQAQQIQSPVAQATLTGLGYHRRTPIAIAYGPPALGGIGLRHLFAEQGSLKVQALIQQIRCNTKLGDLMRTQLQWAQLVCGSSSSLLEDTKTTWPMLSDELWISSLRVFLSLSELSVRIPGINPVKLQREGDFAIMDAVQSLHYCRRDIILINRCRIFLRVNTVSDICNAAGTQVNYRMYKCDGSIRNDSSLNWPRQTRPGQTAITVWQRFLRSRCKDRYLRLQTPLGPWYNIERSRVWGGYFIHDRNVVLTLDASNNIIQYNGILRNRQAWELTNPTPVNYDWRSAIHDSTPIDVLIQDDTDCMITVPRYIRSTRTPIPKTWEEYIYRLPEWARTILQNMVIEEQTPLWLFPEDASTPIFVVSDGSVIAHKGSYAWVLATAHKVLISGRGSVFGSSMSSFWAEVFGILAWSLYLWHYLQFLQLPIKGFWLPFCDNLAAVNSMNDEYETQPKQSMQSDYDILVETKSLLASLRTNQRIGKFTHVKGHQDRTKSLQELPREAQLNVEADRLANTAMSHWVNLPNVPVEKNPIYLTVGNDIVQSNELHLLRWRWRELELQEYYQKVLKLTSSQLHTINWASLRMARGRMRTKLRQFSVKLSINWLASGTQLKKYGNFETLCHLCNGEETNEHIFLCPARSEQREYLYRTLSNRFNESPTGSRAINDVISALRAWTNDEPVLSPHQYIHHQTSIGWGLFISGFQSTHFARHYDSGEPSSIQSGDSWQADVCYCITEALFEIWKDRNKHRNGRDPEREANKAQEEIMAQVRYLYGTQDQMNSNDARNIFFLPMDRRLEMSVDCNREWVRQTRPYVQKCIQQWAEKQKRHLQDIREFFQRKPQGAQSSQNTNVITRNHNEDIIKHDKNLVKVTQQPPNQTPNQNNQGLASGKPRNQMKRAQQFLTNWFNRKRTITHEEDADDQTIGIYSVCAAHVSSVLWREDLFGTRVFSDLVVRSLVIHRLSRRSFLNS
jgi:hypothetical protein